MLLAFDTSSAWLSMGIWDLERDCLGAEMLLDSSATHGTTLLPGLQWLLGRFPGQTPQGIAVCAGPGSFTGLRIGLASAMGLAYAWDVPMLPLSSLELAALNYGLSPDTIWVVHDARHNMVYAAPFKWESNQLIRLAPDRAASPERLARALAPPAIVLGSGARQHWKTLSRAGLALAGESSLPVRPGLLARRAAWYWRQGVRVSPMDLKANYCRPSDAEKRFNRPLENYNLL
jgi:tRNA threonylcarbamoyladenosine biosynthesis protein TsaB